MARLRSVIGKKQGTIHPSPDEVRAQMRVLLGRSEFDASERNRRFLSYVVEETLEGRADRIKAYNIALGAFDRSEDFDPLTDPIVRIEASRLRRSLEHYYLTVGMGDRIRIEVPKGSYVAAFSYRDPGAEERQEAATTSDSSISAKAPEPWHLDRRWLTLALIIVAFAVLIGSASVYIWIDTGRRATFETAASGGPSILVLPFEDTGGDVTRSFIARGLTYEIIGHLTRFDSLFVFGSETSFSFDDTNKLSPDFVLSGSVQASSSRIRVSAILADGDTRQYLWSSIVERDLTTSGLMQIQGEIADQVAAAIAQPYGFIFERTAQNASTQPAESLVAYECIVRFRQYWRSYSDRDFDGVRTCLENTIATYPRYAQAYSSLALLYIDAYRFGFGRSGIAFDPLKRAVDLADHAINLDPDAAEGYLAQSMTLWFLHNIEGSIQAARRGLDRHPHNTDLLAELGFRLALLAKWEDAMPLVNEAYARNPGSPTGYHIATFLHAYMTGDYEFALQAALKVQTPDVVYGPIARAIAYAQLGESAKASREAAEILRIYPNYAEEVADDLARRNVDPTIARAIMDGLAKAGLHLTAQPSNN
jgi:TolB-like protein